MLTWGQIKSAIFSRFHSDTARIIHNVEFGDNLPENDYLDNELDNDEENEDSIDHREAIVSD